MKYSTTLFAILLLGLPAFAQSMDELKMRFEQRFPELRKLKTDGVIGETAAGAVEVRTSVSSSATALIAEENRDRVTLYKLIAQREGTTPEVVAQRNGQRNFQRANAGDWLKGSDGRWFQK